MGRVYSNKILFLERRESRQVGVSSKNSLCHVKRVVG